VPIEQYFIPLAGGGAVHVAATEKTDGDFRIDGPPHELADARARVVDRPWFWLRQVHGARVVDAGEAPGAGVEADAAVTDRRDIALAVHTADCAPIAIVAPLEGRIAAVHAGWRGLVGGVIEAAAEELRSGGATELVGVVGPCIAPDRYEFGSDELDAVAARYGDGVRATTGSGAAALDLREGVVAALEASDVDVLAVSGRCTAASPELYSHRARGELGRQAFVVWIEDAATDSEAPSGDAP
jgi:YfiH family protein